MPTYFRNIVDLGLNKCSMMLHNFVIFRHVQVQILFQQMKRKNIIISTFLVYFC